MKRISSKVSQKNGDGPTGTTNASKKNRPNAAINKVLGTIQTCISLLINSTLPAINCVIVSLEYLFNSSSCDDSHLVLWRVNTRAFSTFSSKTNVSCR